MNKKTVQAMLGPCEACGAPASDMCGCCLGCHRLQQRLAEKEEDDLRLETDQRILSGEVTMVSLDGVAKLKPDSEEDEEIDITFVRADERKVTRAIHEHETCRLRARGEALLDKNGDVVRFDAAEVSIVTPPPLDAPSEDLFERLAIDDPDRLVAYLTEATIRPGLLTFAAEIAGRALPTEKVFKPLSALLDHTSAVVREGAVYALAGHRTKEVLLLLSRVAARDTSAAVREAAAEVLLEYDEESPSDDSEDQQ